VADEARVRRYTAILSPRALNAGEDSRARYRFDARTKRATRARSRWPEKLRARKLLFSFSFARLFLRRESRRCFASSRDHHPVNPHLPLVRDGRAPKGRRVSLKLDTIMLRK